MSGPVDAPAAPAFTLRFTQWECGHHMHRPDDIAVQSTEQAVQILDAISHAISQPGNCRGFIMDEGQAIDFYVTDDYVAVGCGGYVHGRGAPLPVAWYGRPIVVLGDADTVAAMLAEDLADARDWMAAGEIKAWDGKARVDAYDWIATALTREQVETIDKPAEPFGRIESPFELPPVFRDAKEVLAELKEDAAKSFAGDGDPA